MTSPAIHTEAAFESAIEDALLARGWVKGDPAGYDRERAVAPADLFAFIQATQPELWQQLGKLHGAGMQAGLLDALAKERKRKGTLQVLRRGFKFYGKRIQLAYFKPAHGLNPDVLAKYQANRLVVTRQLRMVPGEAGGRQQSVDMALFLNGIPVVTIEIKNQLTGQSVANALAQYKKRDPRLPLFAFKSGALAHFAVDTEEAYFCTRLERDETFFLPFNLGRDGGAGNPAHPSGYRTHYLWESVWAPDSFLDIVGWFLHLQRTERYVEGRPVIKETLFFPRYHQLDVVRQLVGAARGEGAGHNYLIQHSAGSGKTMSIAWLAHRLQSLHDAADRKRFHSVIVITDRRVLDKQLQDAIFQIEHKQGLVATIDQDSSQLARHLDAGTPIIITTLQKFPHVTAKIDALPDRRYAIIVDEAHSSQTGEGAQQMKELLAATSLEEAAAAEDKPAPDYEDRILQVMQSRGPQPNLSFFAFTATPKAKTLEVFGRPGADGKPQPFHLYSMRQAIQEGFILDVLASYTTYKAFFKLAKAALDDPDLPKQKAATALGKYLSLHPHNIAQKTEVMVEHYQLKVRHRIGGQAKAMLVCGSRLHAVRYKQAFDRVLAERGIHDVRSLVAFSGSVRDPDLPDVEYTEVGMNGGITEKQLPERFASADYQILIVANKYQTGFDQPLLHTMYVDKRLDGVQAVQTLSRLNRTRPGKEETFVLDFVNEAEQIRLAFEPFYEQTVVAETADPDQLDALQHELEQMQVFTASEVEAFCQVFYRPKAKPSKSDHAALNRWLQPAVDRFMALDDEAQELFQGKLGAFVRLYGFLSQIMPYSDPELERLYSFGRFLLTKLPRPGDTQPLDLDGDVSLAYYRLQLMGEGSIELEGGGTVKGPTDVGTKTAEDEKLRLSEIIDVLNARFGTEFEPADQLFLDQILAEGVADEDVRQKARANSFEHFMLSMPKIIQSLMVNRVSDNEDLVGKFLDDDKFQTSLVEQLARAIYDKVRLQTPAGPALPLAALITAGENGNVEFKSTLRRNLHTDKNDPAMTHACLKTIAAFLNSQGGTLVIGVDDAGQALGLKPDGFKNEDQALLHLVGLQNNQLGTHNAGYVDARFEDYDGQRVLVVRCKPAAAPVYLDAGNSEHFYIRTSAATNELKPSEIQVYIKQRF
jgi:type I restriction enzyme R subunit